MRIVLNGEEREVEEAIPILELLVSLGLGETLVAVERNAEIVPRAAHASTHLEADDEIEVVHFVGGG